MHIARRWYPDPRSVGSPLIKPLSIAFFSILVRTSPTRLTRIGKLGPLALDPSLLGRYCYHSHFDDEWMPTSIFYSVNNISWHALCWRHWSIIRTELWACRISQMSSCRSFFTLFMISFISNSICSKIWNFYIWNQKWFAIVVLCSRWVTSRSNKAS